MHEKPESFYTYYSKTYRVNITMEGSLRGYLLNLKTGFFDPDNSLILDVYSATNGEISHVDESRFIDKTERARSHYLRGNGAIFALYDTINTIHAQAKTESRYLTDEERALLKTLRQRTFDMWQEEQHRREAGEPPTFQCTFI